MTTQRPPEQRLLEALAARPGDWEHWLVKAAYYAAQRDQCDPALALGHELIRHLVDFAPTPPDETVYGTLVQLGMESLDWVDIAESIHRAYFLCYYEYTQTWPCPWYGTSPAPSKEDTYE